MEGKCYCCGKAGHMANKCRLRNQNKDKWPINKAKDQFLQDSKKPATSKSIPGWNGLHHSFAQSEMKNLVLLDSDSTDTIFCNQELVSNIRESNERLVITTNGGPLVTRMKCDVPYLGEVWFNEKSITNIISLADMAKQFRVTMDTDAEKALLVHLPDKHLVLTLACLVEWMIMFKW